MAQIDVTSSRSFIRPGMPRAAVKISDNSFILQNTEKITPALQASVGKERGNWRNLIRIVMKEKILHRTKKIFTLRTW